MVLVVAFGIFCVGMKVLRHEAEVLTEPHSEAEVIARVVRS